MTYEVGEPIQNSLFEEQQRYQFIRDGSDAQFLTRRRPSVVYPPREGNTEWDFSDVLPPSKKFSPGFELLLVNRIRQGVQEWRSHDYPGVTRTTYDLLKHWQRPEGEKRLFSVQLEAIETVIFRREGQIRLKGLPFPARNQHLFPPKIPGAVAGCLR
ncbi:MAG: hypothetical protein ACRCU2_10160 [Planktothrix sp.]